MVQKALSMTISKSLRDLESVTGEVEDVKLDAELAFGETALTFKEVSFSIREQRGEPGKVILAPCSGHFEPGSLVAVMGPSGCGKTTLLDILADRKGPGHGGVVHVNGRPRDRLFPRMTAYVSQEDVMPGHVKVREAVRFHMCLKEEQPSKLRGEIGHRYLKRRLEVLGLADIEDSFVGDETLRGISGGQKRRLSLAKGLAGGAQLIFCDEPTSGLSATDAEACVKYMRLMAHKYGVTIVVVIHQPRVEVGRLFDHLVLLTSQPGRIIYNGPMRDMPDHFGGAGFPLPPHANPTDFCMDLVTPGMPRSRVNELVACFEANCKAAVDELVARELENERRTPVEILEGRRSRLLMFGDLPPVKSRVYGVNFATQLRFLFKRQLLLRFRDKFFIIADLVMAVAKAVVVGLAYYGIGDKVAQLQAGFFFMVLMTCALDGLKTMPRLIAERTIMKMETAEALYSEWAYIIPFTVIGGLQAMLFNSLFLVLLFLVVGLQWTLFPAVWMWTTLLYFTMDGLYLMIASIARTSVQAQVMSLPFLIVFLLYNGFTVSRATCPWWLGWAIEISPVAYAMQGVVVKAATINHTEDWDATVKTYGYINQVPQGVAVMLGCMTFFRVAQLVALRHLNNLKR